MSVSFKYLPVRARLEPSYMFLSSLNIPWSTETLDWKEFAEQKRTVLPFGGQLPLMNLSIPPNSTPISTTQSKNILKTLRDVYQPQELPARITTDEHVDAADDLSIITRLMNFPQTHGSGAAIPNQLRSFKPYLKFLNHVSLEDTPFLKSDTITIADYAFFHIVDCHETVEPGVLKASPNVIAWQDRVRATSGVGDYLNGRVPLGMLGEHTLPNAK